MRSAQSVLQPLLGEEELPEGQAACAERLPGNNPPGPLTPALPRSGAVSVRFQLGKEDS